MKTNPLVVTLYPNAFGMGYVISETPKELINYGIAKIRPLTKDKYVKRLHKFIKEYRPALILLRDYTDSDNRISKRVMKVIDAFEREAKELELPIFKYSRDDIKEVFSQFDGNNKYVISKTITSWYPELKRYMPDIRKYPNAEHYRMGIFDAFALMLTHHYLE
ncbi:hypothetical protein [Kordia jejudonensis]|uniref:hypothetical protein n=1 Tax=Kordia jejudonensis TaxID=1348245 RepID=UPI000629A2A8|nr:hypothetical protein [Kordia jejudonensis]